MAKLHSPADWEMALFFWDPGRGGVWEAPAEILGGWGCTDHPTFFFFSPGSVCPGKMLMKPTQVRAHLCIFCTELSTLFCGFMFQLPTFLWLWGPPGHCLTHL